MKQIASVLILALAPVVLAAPRQTPAADPAPQASNDSPRSSSSRATSHDRHARKHRASSHRRHHHTAAKTHNS